MNVEFQSVIDIHDASADMGAGLTGGGQGGDSQADPLPGDTVVGQNILQLDFCYNSPFCFRIPRRSFVHHSLHQFHVGALMIFSYT